MEKNTRIYYNSAKKKNPLKLDTRHSREYNFIGI